MQSGVSDINKIGKCCLIHNNFMVLQIFVWRVKFALSLSPHFSIALLNFSTSHLFGYYMLGIVAPSALFWK